MWYGFRIDNKYLCSVSSFASELAAVVIQCPPKMHTLQSQKLLLSTFYDAVAGIEASLRRDEVERIGAAKEHTDMEVYLSRY